MKKLVVLVPVQMHAQLKAIAAVQGRSVHAIVNQLIQGYIRTYGPRAAKILTEGEDQEGD